MDFENLFLQHREASLSGRYIPQERIAPLIEKFRSAGKVTVIGNSVLSHPIHCCQTGTGKIKILLWSQMHGNESTTTKALFDLFNLLSSETALASELLAHFTFYAVPMLNPDGSKRYTRENANGVDLNRDFCDLSQPESRALFALFEQIQPDYCFNLHDQRTIYGVGNSGKPATVSFLAPSFNDKCDINDTRETAMGVIAGMNKALQQFIPGQVGRFDDSFNINCAGDTFQVKKTPTILFEAGHYANDYQREATRKFIFMALVAGLNYIRKNITVHNRIEEYLNIPQNTVCFNDFVYKNVKLNYDGVEKITNFAAQYQEALVGDKIRFEARIADVGSDEIYGHATFDAQNQLYRDDEANIPELDKQANFYLGNMKFVNGKHV